LQALHVGHALDRLLEPAERLGRHRHREEADDVELENVVQKLVIELHAAAVVNPAEALLRVEAEHRTAAEQRGRLVLAVPVDRDGMAAVELAAMRGVLHLEGMYDSAADEIIDLQPRSAHLVDALDV